ncbi:hypothetical protein BDF20DRAFT_876304 [Mycotypha africana]|uniref:uncharacterized protein n=1 Tax=Mycotypha africana TaxID=64632 RepID=UPI0023019665|nr:uncharacterized protein BDF20DRAFT_876304 [Mycotypha africana]KAI8977682.1 hypothetical protein BDF20DRAFT_876304 [Mycotypha africana]
MRLLYAITQGNLDQLMGEETEKLEAVKSICNITEIQLQKVKKCLEQRSKVSNKKALGYVRHFVVFTARKNCEAI